MWYTEYYKPLKPQGQASDVNLCFLIITASLCVNKQLKEDIERCCLNKKKSLNMYTEKVLNVICAQHLIYIKLKGGKWLQIRSGGKKVNRII